MNQTIFSENAIEVSNLTKYYRKFLAVDHINFNIKKGEIFGFLGPNGAGKSTTINILTGIIKPTSGTATVLGYDVIHNPIKTKELIGVVPEETFLYEEMTAWDNINFSAKLHNVQKVKRLTLAKKLLERFGLYERRKNRISTFSRGMKRRITIVTALIHEPSILFLDEPTAGLDVQSSRQIRAIIKELNKNGITVFLTTHYIEEADYLCKHIAIIKNGKIIAIDTPENLKTMTQAEHIIEVSFNQTENIRNKLEELSHVSEVIMVDNKFRLYTDDPSLPLDFIFEFTRKNHLKILSINTLKPTLEDAFVKLTGLHTDDMAFEKERKRYD